MKYNDETNKQGILQDISFWTKADKAVTDADLFVAYTLAERTRNSNFALDKIVGLILKADQRWEWDDTNNSDLPIGRTNIVSGQRDYGITGATYLKITKVMCKDAGGTLHELNPIDKNSPEGKAMNEQTSSGTPSHYDLMGNSLFLEPVPNYTITKGLRIIFQRNVHYFETGDTTQEPGFAQPFHRLVSLYASEDYLLANEMFGKLRGVQIKIKELEFGLLEFYASRNPEDRPRLRMRKENYGSGHLGGGGRGSNPNTI